MLKILGRATSTNVQKVLWFCDDQGRDYDHDNDIGGAFGRNDTPEYLAMNPNGRVPVVIDGAHVMWESNSIIRYLARQSKSELYPSDFAARQIVERWMDWELSLLAPVHRVSPDRASGALEVLSAADGSEQWPPTAAPAQVAAYAS